MAYNYRDVTLQSSSPSIETLRAIGQVLVGVDNRLTLTGETENSITYSWGELEDSEIALYFVGSYIYYAVRYKSISLTQIYTSGGGNAGPLRLRVLSSDAMFALTAANNNNGVTVYMGVLTDYFIGDKQLLAGEATNDRGLFQNAYSYGYPYVIDNIQNPTIKANASLYEASMLSPKSGIVVASPMCLYFKGTANPVSGTIAGVYYAEQGGAAIVPSTSLFEEITINNVRFLVLCDLTTAYTPLLRIS